MLPTGASSSSGAGREPLPPDVLRLEPQRAGRESTLVATGEAEVQAWESSALCQALRQEYPLIYFGSLLTSYVLQPNMDLKYVKEMPRRG